jgi:hypothetical protein
MEAIVFEQHKAGLIFDVVFLSTVCPNRLYTFDLIDFSCE